KESQPIKKSHILTKDEIFKFIEEAPSDPATLVRKVVTIIGYYGALRCAELVSLTESDVVIHEDKIEITIKVSKTDPNGKDGHFFLINDNNNGATALAESGASTIVIKKSFRWKSESVALG
ncbi:hypothetical protein A3Q56_08244, partial [Intoshia linei]